LTTSCTCAGELKQRFLELASLNSCLFELRNNVGFLRKSCCIIEVFLRLNVCFHIFHSQSFYALLARTYVCTGTTSGTVKCGNSHCEGVFRHTCHRQSLDSFRCVCCFFCSHSDRADNCMRADICTTVTLDTVFRLPYRDIYCDTTFLVCGGTGRSCSVYEVLECGYRQRVSFLRSNFGLD